jgi:hypothetical protein
MPEYQVPTDWRSKRVEDAARQLVQQGERVTYRSVLRVMRQVEGHGLPMRDITAP